MCFADFGADVVKVEHPEYIDPVRDWPPSKDDVSLWWKELGRNKRCITLNLSTEEGQELALELAEEADIVMENFRPGTMERWGLGYEDLKAVNEEVIMVRLSGYGQTGPKSQDPGFGSIAEGMSGFAHSNGFPDSEPLLPPMPLADMTAGLFAVQGAMFAIYERELGAKSGTGQVIDVSLFEPLFRLMVSDVEAYDQVGQVRERTGNRSTSSAPRNIYETKDGYITLSASAQRIFENVMHAIDRPDLIEDPRFETNEDRVENVDALDEYIESWTRERPRDEVIEIMTEHDAIVGPIYDISEIFDSELYQARDDIIWIDDDDLGELAVPNTHPKMSRTPGEVSFAGPRHGEYNEAVYLGELGMDEDRYEELREKDVI
jgi:formyl-CoA transferase